MTTMQPPMQQAGHHDIARQPRTVQEEQQPDGDLGGKTEPVRRLAGNRQQRCQDDRADQKEGEGIGQETAHIDRPDSEKVIGVIIVIMISNASNNDYHKSG